MTIDAASEGPPAPQWRPIGRNLRRVLGVLVEKAKTTPDNYPLTLSGLVAGCKQKSNRDPLMDLDEDQVTDSLDQLRILGAVSEVQGSGRVNKFRHRAYEWLGVNAREAAIMTELLLRGPQSTGELRARASRMEAFANLEEVQEVLGELETKGLVEPLTPAGRGQTFGHTLYESHERTKVLEKAGAMATAEPPRPAAPAARTTETGQTVSRQPSIEIEAVQAGGVTIQQLQEQITALRNRLARLENELGIEN